MEELIGKPRVQQWEYKLVRIHLIKKWLGLVSYIPEESVSDLLEGLGLLGWELCSERSDSQGCAYIFKRPFV